MNKANAILEAVLRTEGVRLHRLLYRLTLSTDAAEDLLQELCVKLLGSAGFASAEKPVGFAVRAAINLALDWRHSRRRRRTDEVPENLSATGTGGLELAGQREEIELVLGAVQHVPESLREILVLRHVDGESYETIATMLGKTPHQVRALAHKGVRAVRNVLEMAKTPKHGRVSHA